MENTKQDHQNIPDMKERTTAKCPHILHNTIIDGEDLDGVRNASRISLS
jgi:hypothetical protein